MALYASQMHTLLASSVDDDDGSRNESCRPFDYGYTHVHVRPAITRRVLTMPILTPLATRKLATQLMSVINWLRKRCNSMQNVLCSASAVNTCIFTCVSYAEARNSYRLDVCPSVRPSHAGIVSKRLNILSCFLRHTIAHSF